jgi:hypothetical protein
MKLDQELALVPFYLAGMIDSYHISRLLLKSTGRVRCEFQRYWYFEMISSQDFYKIMNTKEIYGGDTENFSEDSEVVSTITIV